MSSYLDMASVSQARCICDEIAHMEPSENKVFLMYYGDEEWTRRVAQIVATKTDRHVRWDSYDGTYFLCVYQDRQAAPLAELVTAMTLHWWHIHGGRWTIRWPVLDAALRRDLLSTERVCDDVGRLLGAPCTLEQTLDAKPEEAVQIVVWGPDQGSPSPSSKPGSGTRPPRHPPSSAPTGTRTSSLGSVPLGAAASARARKT